MNMYQPGNGYRPRLPSIGRNARSGQAVQFNSSHTIRVRYSGSCYNNRTSQGPGIDFDIMTGLPKWPPTKGRFFKSNQRPNAPRFFDTKRRKVPSILKWPPPPAPTTAIGNHQPRPVNPSTGFMGGPVQNYPIGGVVTQQFNEKSHGYSDFNGNHFEYQNAGWQEPVGYGPAPHLFTNEAPVSDDHFTYGESQYIYHYDGFPCEDNPQYRYEYSPEQNANTSAYGSGPHDGSSYNNYNDVSDSDYSNPYAPRNYYSFNSGFLNFVRPGSTREGKEEEECGRVARNPLNSVTKTITRNRPNSFETLSFAAKVRLQKQASLPTQLNANPTSITLQPTTVTNTPDKLYHYTTEDGAFGILKDKFMRPKEMEGNWFDPSSRFGTGIYFTDLPPTSKTETILLNNYNKIFLSNLKYTEFCFEFKSKDLPELLLCVDSTCNKLKEPTTSAEEWRRKIWVSKVDKLDLNRIKGKYYFRDLHGFDVPQEVKELPM